MNRGKFMKHKIVFFDMDGTLYQTENDVIQESALDAIQTLKDKGYIVCAATGRPGSLTLAHGQNSQMSFMYGFFFVKFLFFTVVCVVIMI